MSVVTGDRPRPIRRTSSCTQLGLVCPLASLAARPPVAAVRARRTAAWSRLSARFARCSTTGGCGRAAAYGAWSRLSARFARCSTTGGCGRARGVRRLVSSVRSLRSLLDHRWLRSPLGVRRLVSSVRSLRSLLDHRWLRRARVVRRLVSSVRSLRSLPVRIWPSGRGRAKLDAMRLASRPRSGAGASDLRCSLEAASGGGALRGDQLCERAQGRSGACSRRSLRTLLRGRGRFRARCRSVLICPPASSTGAITDACGSSLSAAKRSRCSKERQY